MEGSGWAKFEVISPNFFEGAEVSWPEFQPGSFEYKSEASQIERKCSVVMYRVFNECHRTIGWYMASNVCYI
jgi:hypothetical protein